MSLPDQTLNAGSVNAKPNRVNEIDALRGLAILSVVVLHWFVQPMASTLSELGLLSALNLLSYGVDLFFVISGFLIGQILLKISGNPMGIRTFYIRRVLRIWPLYYLILLLTYLLANGAFAKAPYWSFVFFVFNFWGGRGDVIHPVLYPLWSIAIEEQFYAAGPLIFHVFSNKRHLVYLLGGYIFISPFLRLALRLYTEIQTWEFTFTRLDGICLGLLLSLLLSSANVVSYISARIRYFRYLSILLLVSSVLLKMTLPGLAWHSFGISIIVLAFGCLLIVVYFQAMTNPNSSVPSMGILSYLGVRCYSIYLFHTLFMFIAYFLIENLPMRFAFQIILTIGFAHISWKYIESPLIKLGQRFSYANAPL